MDVRAARAARACPGLGGRLRNRHLHATSPGSGCERVIATDHDAEIPGIARRRFDGEQRVRVLDLDPSVETELHKLRDDRIQTIVSVNVLEHIGDDERVYIPAPPRPSPMTRS